MARRRTVRLDLLKATGARAAATQRAPRPRARSGIDNGNKGTDNGNKGTNNGNKGTDNGIEVTDNMRRGCRARFGRIKLPCGSSA